MPHTDPLSDLITRIRNAQNARHKNVTVNGSKAKKNVLEIMASEGYIKGFRTLKDKGRSIFDIELRYRASGEPYIREIKRISRPGIRRYSGYRKFPRVRSNFGVLLLSTSKGIMTDTTARKEKLGGELICSIF